MREEESKEENEDALIEKQEELGMNQTEKSLLLTQKERSEERNLIVAEEKDDGQILWSVYSQYLSQSPGACWNVTSLLFAIVPFALLGYLRFFIAEWASRSLTDQNKTVWKLQFSVVSVVAILVSGFTAFLIGAIFVHLSHALHNSMLERVAHAPMRFFHSNPLGRIINRFSKDTAMADSVVTFILIQWLQMLYACVVFAFLSLVVYPLLLLVLLAVLLLMLLVVKFALTASIDALRHDVISRSPINSFFASSLESLVTIRAYQQENSMNHAFQHLVDENGRAFFTYQALCRWIGLQIEVIGLCWIAGTLLFTYFASASSPSAQSDVALAATSTLTFMGSLQFVVTYLTDIQSAMSSVQRMQAYTSLDQEKDAVLPSDSLLPLGWPQNGAIRFERATLRYREDLDPVLKEVEFEVEPKMKVGVVGRTGAGKSSLLQALFRLVECDRESSIFIDGRSSSSIGLSTLRRAISIIPQSPFIFEGTVRDNLDPFAEYSDEEVWSALEDVQLRRVVEQFEGKLEEPISEGATVFSVGQKQLICLARAILRKNKILVLDEATANVDLETDALIQEAIKRKFWESTVVTVAHRLETIIGSDRVLVLSRGEVKEYDAPSKLLQKSDGFFRRMVAAAGVEKEQELLKTARKGSPPQ